MYISDVKIIPPETMEYLKSIPKIKVLVLDLLAEEGIYAHIGLYEALEIYNILKPEQFYGTGMACGLGLHDITEKRLKEMAGENLSLAYDGMVLEGFSMYTTSSIPNPDTIPL